MAIAFIVIGLVCIFFNHLLRHLDSRHVFDNIPYLNAALRYVKKRAGWEEPLVTKRRNGIVFGYG